MAVGEGGKHNKAHSSLEFNVLGQKTEYRYQRPGMLEKSCPHNVENTSAAHTQQVIYSAVCFFVSEPRAPSGSCESTNGKKKIATTKEQFICTMTL